MSNIEDLEVEELQRLYEQQLQTYIDQVEQHLSLTPGTLGDIKHDSDYLKILKMHATVEPLLNQLLEASVGRALKHPKVNFPGGDAIAEVVLNLNLEKKVKLALDSELITESQAAFIKILGRVRNRYAHSIQNMNLSVFQITAKISPGDDGLSVRCVLFGVSSDVAKGKYGAIVVAMMSANIFNIFASLIGTVVRGINPPPVPPGLWEALNLANLGKNPPE
jgi:hypothetical protein